MNKYTTPFLQNNLMILAFNDTSIQYYSMALDITESKILKPTISKAKGKESKNICKIYFLKKGVAHIITLLIFILHQ